MLKRLRHVIAIAGACALLALSVPPARAVTGGGASAPPVIRCHTFGAACNVGSIRPGQSAIISGVTSSRASTTTPATDATFQFLSLPQGWYRIELYLVFVSGGGGEQLNLQVTNYTLGDLQEIAVSKCSATVAAAAAKDGASLFACTSASTVQDWVHDEQILFQASGTPSNIAVQWAQNSSNASATQMTGYWMLTRLN